LPGDIIFTLKTMQRFLGLRTCIYKVAELEKATLWYATVFGVSPYFNEPFYVGFNIGGFELGLQPMEGHEHKGENVLTYWGVEDIDSVYNHLLSSGASSHEAPQNVGGDIMVASVIDPWNNIVGIIYNPGFELKPTPQTS
jgi:predicted enzyme related to lactoylglutathione lyase